MSVTHKQRQSSLRTWQVEKEYLEDRVSERKKRHTWK